MDTEQFIDNVILKIPHMNPKSKSDFKCAPGREYEAGSCISLMVLEEMAKAYNQSASSTDAIRLSSNMSVLNPQKYKIYLVYEIGKRVGNKCDKQKCWAEQDFIKHMADAAREELVKYTFRPNSPQGRFDWLSTLDIEKTMSQYEDTYGDFRFFQAVPIDFSILPQYKINHVNYDKLYKSGIKKLGIVFNLDEHYKNGSHWVAMFTDLENPSIYYFDSFGVKPGKEVRALMRDQTRYLTEKRGIPLNDIKVDYNHIQHQKENTECGVYSINFLVRMGRGDDFQKICKNIIRDKQINKCRLIYFDKYNKKKKR